MNQQSLIEKTAAFAKETLSGESTGHDWWHVYRVWQNAKHIGKAENADMYVVELAALLHDIADHKFHNGDHEVGPRVAREWLEKLETETVIIERVIECMRSCSFSSGHVATTIEALVVQDADRLDALGAIGIARVFATGAKMGDRMLFDPEKPKETQPTSIGHFYEKLLLLKNRMNTATGRQMAEDRHLYLEQFLDEFYAEWEGIK